MNFPIKWSIVYVSVIKKEECPMLMGNFQNSIDGKNRISVPAKFRDELGYKCVVTRGLDNCLDLYPEIVWKAETEKIAHLPKSDPKARAYIRFKFGAAFEVEIDKQGRTVVPQVLKDYAGFDKEIVTVGAVDHVELWSKDAYEGFAAAGAPSDEDMAYISERYQV